MIYLGNDDTKTHLADKTTEQTEKMILQYDQSK